MNENAALLLTTGNGPDECRIALKLLIDKMKFEASAYGLAFKAVAASNENKHGPASAIVMVDGDQAARFVSSFVGTIRFSFPSPVRPNHKRQNWFVGVSLFEDAGQDNNGLRPEDIRYETLRAGGPGGQHQNTTDSAVRAIHVPTGLVAISRDERSQHQNKAKAVRRLSQMLEAISEDKRSEKEQEKFQTHKGLERGNEIRHFKIGKI